MAALPADLQQRLRRYNQDHLLAGGNLDDNQRRELTEQLAALDFDLLSRLYARREEAGQLPVPDRIQPVTVVPLDRPDNTARAAEGVAALRRGQLAVLLVAGGQGSRLGFEHPKGMYPVGPISNKSLFQVHAEKVLALSRRSNVRVPFLIMTSPATHAETVAFFTQHAWFGLAREQVAFFQQGTMPALDLRSGRLLLEAPGRLFLSPDGHGGTLTALASSGLLARLKGQGIRQVFYFQVDNPLVKIGDPLFLGHHLAARAEVSSKVIAKRDAAEKAGVFACIDGRCAIVEYSDLPRALAEETDASGKLKLWAGNPAIHLFEVEFLERMTQNPEAMPFHVAKKKVACHDDAEPATENALKFERFIFDVLPQAHRWTAVETPREEEFAPLKNAEGDDSPATVERGLRELAARWIEQAGGSVPRDAEGRVSVALEVSPLFALDASEFAAKADAVRVTAARYFE